MPVKQRSKSDPRYRILTDSIKTYKCPRCAKEENTYSTETPFCSTCFTYLLPHKRVDDLKVREIVNRYNTLEETDLVGTKGSMNDLWDEDRIEKYITITIIPEDLGRPLVLRGRFDSYSWLKGIIEVSWGDKRGLMQINDFGGMFKSLACVVPGNEVEARRLWDEGRVPKRVKGKIAYILGAPDIEILSRENFHSWYEDVIRLKWGSNQAHFSMRKIAEALTTLM